MSWIYDMIEELTREVSALKTQVKFLQEHIRKEHLDNLLAQNDLSRKKIESIFNIKSDDAIDTLSLDGLLSDYIDERQNSSELVRSVRDNE